jgi:hypothetical protein
VEPAPSAAEAAEKQEQDEAAKLWAEFPDDGAEKKPEKTNGEKISNEFTESQAERIRMHPLVSRTRQAKPPLLLPQKTSGPTRPPNSGQRTKPRWLLSARPPNDAKAQAGRMRKQYEELKASAERAADSRTPKLGDTLDQGLADYPEIARPVKDALARSKKSLKPRPDRSAATLRPAPKRSTGTSGRSRAFGSSTSGVGTGVHSGAEGEAVRRLDQVAGPPVKHVKTVFETNNEHIFDAAAAIEVFDAFKADIAGTDPTPGNGQTQELSAKRAAQLDGSRSPRDAQADRQGCRGYLGKAIPSRSGKHSPMTTRTTG